MPLPGRAAMLLSFDVDPAAIEEHDRWHTHEHLPERLSIPGFRRGTRWVSTTGTPRYMVIYEVESVDTLVSQAYLDRLDNPTPWTTRMMTHYRGMTRGLCAIVGSLGNGQGGSAALIRFTPTASAAADLQHWLLDDALPSVPETSGLGSAHLLQGLKAAAMTNEQRIRGADRGVDCALVVTGYDDGAVQAFARQLCAEGYLERRGAADVTCATYRLAYSLAAAEMSA